MAAMLVALDAEATATMRRRCASGENQADEAVMLEVKRRSDTVEAARQLAKLEATRGPRGATGRSDVERATLYLSAMQTGPRQAHKAALAVVRGFALDEATAVQLLETEFLPRYHRKVVRREVWGMVRWASRAHVELGYLLKRERA